VKVRSTRETLIVGMRTAIPSSFPVSSGITSLEEVNKILEIAAEGELKGILDYSDKPLVSCDYNHNVHSSNFDSLQTKVNGSLVKVMSWYDNEWGFCNRMLDNTLAIFDAK
jgi:glyceraldehyde 3-phosphate dehydrogenase